jgi:hypothetical protein
VLQDISKTDPYLPGMRSFPVLFPADRTPGVAVCSTWYLREKRIAQRTPDHPYLRIDEVHSGQLPDLCVNPFRCKIDHEEIIPTGEIAIPRKQIPVLFFCHPEKMGIFLRGT